MTWTPAGPSTTTTPGRGWTVDGPDHTTDDAQGWWVVQQAAAGTEILVEDHASLLAKVIGTSQITAESAGSIIARLIATGLITTTDGAILQAKLTGGYDILTEHGAYGSLKASGGYDIIILDGAALRAALIGGHESVTDHGAYLFAHLLGGDETFIESGSFADYAPVAPTTVTVSATGAYSYSIPAWCKYIDIAAWGGGASGRTGNGSNSVRGNGGVCGSGIALTYTRGTSLAWSATTITGTVGAGGAQAPDTDHAAPNPGASTTILSSGWSETWTISGGVGVRPEDNQSGQTAVTHTISGITYAGGAGGSSPAAAGTAPGGAGAGGNGGVFGIRQRGGAGGAGRAIFRAYQ